MRSKAAMLPEQQNLGEMRQTKPIRLFTTLCMAATALVISFPGIGIGIGIAHAAPASSHSSRPGVGGAAGTQAGNQARSASSDGNSATCKLFAGIGFCSSTNPTIDAEWANSGDTSGCDFGYTLDWGDGTPDTTGTRAGGPPSTSLLAKHTYALSGIYVISLTGDVISGDCTFNPASGAFVYKGPCTTGDVAPSASSQQFTSCGGERGGAPHRRPRGEEAARRS